MITICVSDAMARAAKVPDSEWVALMADPVFCEQVESVIGAGQFPAVSQLRECGSGMNYITGLILLLRELYEPANVPFPRGVLHELCRPHLPKLVALFNGEVTVIEPLYNANQTLKQVAHMLGVTENIYRDVPLAVRALQVALRDGIAAKQAKIDALMFEFCPDEMTAEQIAEWAKHQRRAPDDCVPLEFRLPE